MFINLIHIIPTRSLSAGKLINFLVADGGHVNAGEVYAEIEVMKMVMELRVAESGSVTYVKRSGATLEPGSIVARLTLDDPSRVRNAELYSGKLPQASEESSNGGKLNQVFAETKAFLDCVLHGFTIPEPYFTTRVKQAVETLVKCLKDPALPLYELRVS